VPDQWIPCDERLPERDQVVLTKIDDAKGCRNEQPLKRGPGKLWFFADGSMYVYYQPSHWRPLSD
jgi:hypothetical protein